MPIFMDRHDVWETTAADVADAHRRDLEVQDRYGVKFLTYWFDQSRGTIFCLVDAPDKEAAQCVHREAHGHVAGEIMEVPLAAVEAFLGRIQDPAPQPGQQPGSHLDSGHRAILFTDIVGSTEMTARPSANSAQRNSQREALSAQLAEAIRTILKSGALDGIVPKPAPFARIESTTAPSVFFEKNEPLTIIDGYGRSGAKPVMPDGPKLYLRLIPTSEAKPISSADAYEMVRGPLRIGPMSMRHPDGYFDGRNKYGAIDILLDTHNNTVLSATQVFQNREIWGVDRTLLKNDFHSPSEVVSYLPSVAIERVYKDALTRYLRTAKEGLGVQTPLVVIAGATGVEGFRMAIQNVGDKFSPPIFSPNIEFSTRINSYDQDISSTLLPFFQKLWEECGLRRPDKLN